MTNASLRLLFICSRNRWRSPTAERVFSKRAGLDCRSRGLSSKSIRKLVREDLSWADLILVMERSHAKRLRRDFRVALGDKNIHVLEIPDLFEFMDPDLVQQLETTVWAVLEGRDRPS